MSKKHLESGFPVFNAIILLLGGIGSSVLSYYVTKTALSEAHPQIVGLIMGVIIGVFGLICLVGILSLNIYRIVDRQLQIVSVLGFKKSVIPFYQILSWNEIEKETKHTKWKDLTLHLKNRDVKISSYSFPDYHRFKRALTRGKKRNKKAEMKWRRRHALRLAIGFMVIGALLYYYAYHSYQNRNTIYVTYEMEWVTSVITNEVKIHKGSKKNRSIRLQIADYPDFIFDLDGLAYTVADEDAFVADLKKGDEVEILITREQFQKKLTREWEMDFWDKSVNYKFISIYGLRGKGIDYLTLSDFNQAKLANNREGYWYLLAFATFVFGGGVYTLYDRKKFRTK